MNVYGWILVSLQAMLWLLLLRKAFTRWGRPEFWDSLIGNSLWGIVTSLPVLVPITVTRGLDGAPSPLMIAVWCVLLWICWLQVSDLSPKKPRVGWRYNWFHKPRARFVTEEPCSRNLWTWLFEDHFISGAEFFRGIYARDEESGYMISLNLFVTASSATPDPDCFSSRADRVANAYLADIGSLMNKKANKGEATVFLDETFDRLSSEYPDLVITTSDPGITPAKIRLGLKSNKKKAGS